MGQVSIVCVVIQNLCSRNKSIIRCLLIILLLYCIIPNAYASNEPLTISTDRMYGVNGQFDCNIINISSDNSYKILVCYALYAHVVEMNDVLIFPSSYTPIYDYTVYLDNEHTIDEITVVLLNIAEQYISTAQIVIKTDEGFPQIETIYH